MKRWLAVTLLSAGLLIPFGFWTVASADDDGSQKTDFAFFDGTNPATEAPPMGGAECSVKGPATLHASVSAHSSGPDGFVRLTYQDGDWVQFPIKSDGVLQLTQAIGGTPGVSRRVRLSNSNADPGARLVGSLSVIGKKPSCQSCSFDDGGGGAGCQNNP
jgi:hypothetical protein